MPPVLKAILGNPRAILLAMAVLQQCDIFMTTKTDSGKSKLPGHPHFVRQE